MNEVAITLGAGSPPRLLGLDIARGFVVAASAAMSHLPPGGFGWARHADWYGLTLLDLVFPAFITLFGAGIAVAYRRGVRWRRLLRRTVVLLILGLLFNAAIEGSLDIGTWRVTGVLVQFAIIGLIVTVVTRWARAWWQAFGLGLLLLSFHAVVSLAFSQPCADGLPQPGCNPSILIDPFVFGDEHVYVGGAAGYEPEGIATLPGQVANALFGYAAGAILFRYRSNAATRRLLVLAAVLLVGGLLIAMGLPIAKRPWTPSFAAVSAAIAIGILAAWHFAIERLPTAWPSLGGPIGRGTWLLEAFGRNSLLTYFGKYMLVVILARVAAPWTRDQSVAEASYDWMANWSPQPQVTYAVLMFSFWAAVAAVLHWRRWYISA